MQSMLLDLNRITLGMNKKTSVPPKDKGLMDTDNSVVIAGRGWGWGNV